MEDIITKTLILKTDWKEGDLYEEEFKNFKEITIDFANKADDETLENYNLYKILQKHYVNRNKIKVFIIKEDL